MEDEAKPAGTEEEAAATPTAEAEVAGVPRAAEAPADAAPAEAASAVVSEGGRKKAGLYVVAAILVVLLYILLWPLSASIEAEHIDNPMGENFTVAGVERSNVAVWSSPQLSQETMCGVIQAWATAHKTAAKCTDKVFHTAGHVNQDDEESQYLWSEMRGVTHGEENERESFCFVSRDGGHTWKLGTGLAIFGLIPIQTASDDCTGFRKFKYRNSDDVDYKEERIGKSASKSRK